MDDKDFERSRLAQLVSRIGLHEHVCLVYRTEEEQFSAAIPFMSAGLERGQKCLYIAKEHPATALLEAMRAERVDVDSAIKQRAFELIDRHETYLQQLFTPHDMIHFLVGSVRDAKASRFPALRVAGDMSWALGLPLGPKPLIEFEVMLNHFVRDHDATVICQYDRKLFPAEVILGVLRTHPTVVYGDRVCNNPYYVPPDEFLETHQSDREVERLLSNMQAYENKKEELRQSEERFRHLSGRLLQLQDEERRKIARDLHDSTGQDLVALALTLRQLHASLPPSSRKLRKLVSGCQAVADQCIREVRTVSYLLHPPMLDEAGLEDAIRHYVDGFAKRSGIQVELEVSPRFGRISQNVELNLFRVVQESLINIQRHSGSRKALIRLDRNSEKVTLEVRDKGRGIPGSERKQTGAFPFEVGVGIPSMHERVKQIGGLLEIDSNIHGTAVRVTIPVHD